MKAMRKIWPAVLLALALSACAGGGSSQPSARERAIQVSNIKAQLAVEYMRAQDYRQAVNSIDEALSSNSKNENAWLVRAQIYQYLKVPDKAQESFLKALAISPNSAEINNNYGWFLCNTQNKPAEAIAYFDKALSDPTYPNPQVAYLNKGILQRPQRPIRLVGSLFGTCIGGVAAVFPGAQRAGAHQNAGRQFEGCGLLFPPISKPNRHAFT